MEFLNKLKQLDAYPKTLEDFRVRTTSGAFISVTAGIFILWLFISELVYYLSVDVKPELFVDTTRGEKLRINMDITFHNLPCGFLSVDAMDISGEHQLDVDHNIFKKRLDKYGNPKENVAVAKHEQLGDSQLKAPAKELPADYCGSCYGAGSGDQCCNTCDSVLEVYRKRGWTTTPESFEQCQREGWSEKVQEQMSEGCQVYGYLLVNKVAGNFHFAPGKSFQQHHMHVHDLQPYKDMKWNMSHTISRLSFGREFPGIINPLDGVTKSSEDSAHALAMYQYFIKIVPTIYSSLNGRLLNTNQFSVTEYFKPLQNDGHGLPGVFFMYDLSPIMVKYTETSKSFAHFLTGVCAIIGGVFTVAGIVDSLLYHSLRTLKKKVDLGKAN